jgi:pyruvate ferredoxin oxidoreductase gamma subunit/2-oxoisovalerate ferredoxin oxidoreductase gamma subunit
VVASELLAAALFKEGQFVQAFPAFGVERRGAPVTAFIRIDSAPIRLRCQIYNPDHVVVLDPTLIPVVDVTAGLKPGGWILINSDRAPGAFSALNQHSWRVVTIDAGAIAVAHSLGTHTNPIVNTAILGAVARVMDIVTLGSIAEAIEEGVPIHPEKNIAAARDAYAQVKLAPEPVETTGVKVAQGRNKQ